MFRKWPSAEVLAAWSEQDGGVPPRRRPGPLRTDKAAGAQPPGGRSLPPTEATRELPGVTQQGPARPSLAPGAPLGKEKAGRRVP